MTHVLARRGARALLAKNVFRSDKCAGPCTANEQASRCVGRTVVDSAKIVLFLNHIVGIPPSVKCALSLSPCSDTAFTLMTALVYSFLVRTDGDANRPVWAKHIPLIYHRSKELAKSDLGESIASLAGLVESKVKSIETLAELIFLLFQSSDCFHSDSPSSSLVTLFWVSETLESAFALLNCRLKTTIDDHFTTRVSPYRGIRLSRPEWEVLNTVIKEAFVDRTGVPLTVAQDEKKSSACRLDDFLIDLHAAKSAQSVFSLVSAKVIQVIANFNSRYLKASRNTDSPSVEKMLNRPWSPDADLRAIVKVYTNIETILKIRTSTHQSNFVPLVLLANVLIGGWIGISRYSQPNSQECMQHDTHVDIPFLPKKLFASYAPVPFEFKRTLAKTQQETADQSCVKIQAFWRGSSTRKSKTLKVVANLVLFTGWPKKPPNVEMSEKDLGDTESILTKASLMRLPTVPSAEKLSSPITSHRQKPILAEATGFTSLDLIQADHIACAKMYFIFAFNVFLRLQMV